MFNITYFRAMCWIIIFIVDISVILDNSISLKVLTNITSCQQYLFIATQLIKIFFLSYSSLLEESLQQMINSKDKI